MELKQPLLETEYNFNSSFFCKIFFFLNPVFAAEHYRAQFILELCMKDNFDIFFVIFIFIFSAHPPACWVNIGSYLDLYISHPWSQITMWIWIYIFHNVESTSLITKKYSVVPTCMLSKHRCPCREQSSLHTPEIITIEDKSHFFVISEGTHGNAGIDP